MSTTNYSVTDNHSAAMLETALRPQWLDEQLYPFQSRFVEIDGIGVATAIRRWWDEEIEP